MLSRHSPLSSRAKGEGAKRLSTSRGTPTLLHALQIVTVLLAATFLLGADPSGARFENLGHKLMCRCGCNQILLECNHVGCSYSEKMR